MFYHCDPTAFTPGCAFRRRPCLSPCSMACSDAMLFLPVLLFLFGPLLVTLAFKVFFFVMPLVFVFGTLKCLFNQAAQSWDDAQPFFRFAEVPEAASAGSGPTVSRAVPGGNCRGIANESVAESNDAYEIHVPAVGVRPQDLQATVVDHTNCLRVVGESAIASVDRSIRLPRDADLSSISLSVCDGLVRIAVQKRKARTLHVRPATAHEDLASASASPGHGTPRAARRDIPIEPKQAEDATEAPAQPIKDDEFVDVSQQ